MTSEMTEIMNLKNEITSLKAALKVAEAKKNFYYGMVESLRDSMRQFCNLADDALCEE